MIVPVREVLATAGRLFATQSFDPATTTQTFRIAATDYSMMTVVPDLVRLLRQQAPGGTLDIRPFDARALGQLEDGDLDASFWAAERPGAPFGARTLFRETYLGLVCASHPLLGKANEGTLTVGDYLAHPHVMARWSDPRQSPVDARLAALGHARRVAVTTPNFAANIAALPGTDLIMTLPSRLCGTLDGRAVLAIPRPGVPGEAIPPSDTDATAPRGLGAGRRGGGRPQRPARAALPARGPRLQPPRGRADRDRACGAGARPARPCRHPHG
nr:LysR substrate-binding domain-containing protein [Rubellimicrobium aerolatum]